ncbi:MAG: protein-L-isoaspartate O-methyltransferase, partial [Paraglaciecola sp.]|nr:protein-L-isoaspartate O-methyltransferase [Paraglaciecola sp.]
MRATFRKGDSLAQLIAQEGISNSKVLGAIANIPRELFIPDALRHKAYQNTALPIGQGQTISQPYIVARMTE